MIYEDFKLFVSRYKKFKFFLGPQVWFFFRVSFLIGVIWFAVESSFIFVLQAFLSAIGLMNPENALLSRYFPASISGAILLLFFFGIFRAALLMARQVASEMTNQAFLKTQRVRIIEYSLSNAAEVSTHDLLNVFNERIPVAAVVIQYMTTVATMTISSLCFVVLGAFLAPVELAIGMGSLLLLFVLLRFINNRIDKLGAELIKETKNLTRSLVIGLKNHFLLKLYNLTESEIRLGKEAANAYQRLYISYIWLSSAKSAFPQFSGAVILSLVCLISLHFIHTPGAKLVSFIYIFMRLAQSASEANGVLMSIRFNMPGFRELFHWHLKSETFLNAKEGSLPSKGYPPIKAENELIVEAQGVSFGYDTKRPLFSDLSFRVGPGEILLIKGPSGGGKSTLLTLLVGMRAPVRGTILVNQQPVREISDRISEITAYVGPDPYLIPGSFRDNLLYANQRANQISDSELRRSLDQTLLGDLIDRSPKGLDTEIREAAELSTGQQQRLAIARALLRKPRILILDEATANLDLKTEAEIVEVIRALPNKPTTIVVSHKSSFDAISDQIIEIGNG
jgi:ATP-binding cassette subfamily B protein